jgi:hypothetical protein
MTRQLDYASDYPYPAEEIFRAGIKPAYVEAEATYLKHEQAKILDVTEDGPAGGRLELTYKVETSLPSWAKKILPSRNTITESHVWHPAAADGSRTYTFDVAIATVPAKAKGSATITPTGEASCRVETKIEITAWMPVVGGKLEDLVARDLGTTVEGKMAFMGVWKKEEA